MSFIIFQDKNDEVFILAESKVVAIKVSTTRLDSVFAHGNIEFEGNMIAQCDSFEDAMKFGKLLAVPVENKQ